jgi:cation diffusion facilitator family transporter
VAASGDSRKVVIAALLGNAGIAVAKFVAAALTGSVTMLAEGVHSVADTTNQALLLVGMGLSKKVDPERYPLGRAKESYFWSFIVSLMLFFLGGIYAIYEGVHKLLHPSAGEGSQLIAVIVLVVSLALESGSFFVAFREFQKSRAGRPIFEALFHGKDPTIPVVLLEDTGAMLGLVIALVAVVTAWVTGSSAIDGVGSLVIGVLLCAIGVTLAHDTRSLLIGESATPEMRARAVELARGTEGIEDVSQLLSMHLGPASILLALKVRFRRGMSIEEVERVTNALEERIRREMPDMKRIFVEADSEYDEARDPERRSSRVPPEQLGHT